jgi:large repetitive protein
LKLNQVIPYGSKPADQDGLSFEKAFTITVTNVNEAPTAVALSVFAVAENASSGTTVGALSSTDVDAGDTFTYTLVSGTGSTDNASFAISGANLVTAAVFDFETKSSYAVRVRTTDAGGLTFDRELTITVTNVNETPTDIALSATSVAENVAANSTIGTLSTTDVDASNTFTYTLVSGTGDTDNAAFNIGGSSLRVTASPNFEAKSSYAVRIKTSDQDGLSFEKAFTITVTNVNETPTDLALSATSVAENVAANSTIGTLSTTDVDASNTFTYTLVAGTGDTDNAAFNISGSSLRITASPNFEAKSSYTVRIKTADQDGLSFEKAFTITVTNVNETPTDLALSATTVAENVAANSTIGALSTTDVDASNTFTYTLVAGTGDTENAAFNISGSSLRITASPDFETKSSYSVRVRTSDQGGLSFEKAFTITILDVVENVSATDMTISSSAINEKNPLNASVGTLSSTDADAGDTHTYTLVSGTGSTDNASFNILNNQLRAGIAFDFETKSSYSVRVRTTDTGGLSFEKVFTITVTNVNEAPTAVALSVSAVAENASSGTTVGALSSTDVDAGDTFTYTLVSGTGSTDNASFAISGANLVTAAVFDFETKSSYAVRVRTTDAGGLTFDRELTITVTNVNETPSDLALSSTTVAENVATNSTIGTLSTTDVDASNTFTYTLVSGTGDTDNTAFNISGSSLRVTASPNFEAKSSYTVRIKTADQDGLSFEKAFTITVTNVNETPTDIALSSTTVAENVATNSTIGTLSTTDVDASNTFTYTLVAGTGDTDNNCL